MEEKIQYFIGKYVNPLYQFKTMIGELELVVIVERYNSIGAYKNFYAIEIENGLSLYTIYKGYILFFIEIGDKSGVKEMHVNYYVKYNTLDTEKILGDINFVTLLYIA